MAELFVRVAPVLGFLLALTIIAEVAERAGVFDVAAHWAARAARGRVWALWLLVVALATASTIVLSLDTTAVLLTPVVLSVARQAGLDRTVFALTTVWLANTASLLLPVSNLTNLLALHSFSSGQHATSYIGLMWRPALAAILATIAVTAALYWRTLRGRFTATGRPHIHDRPLLIVAAAVCVVLAPLFASGLTPLYPAAVAAVLLLVALAIRDPRGLKHLKLPWSTVVALIVLFVVIDALGTHGLTDLVGTLTGSGESLGDLLRLSGVSAVLANLGNNLPVYLAVEPVTDTALRHGALLVGVNAGSIVTIWGSVATLLWRDRCRRADAEVPMSTFVRQSLLVAVASVVAATLALSL